MMKGKHYGGWQCIACDNASLVRSNFKFTPTGAAYCRHEQSCTSHEDERIGNRTVLKLLVPARVILSVRLDWACGSPIRFGKHRLIQFLIEHDLDVTIKGNVIQTKKGWSYR